MCICTALITHYLALISIPLVDHPQKITIFISMLEYKCPIQSFLKNTFGLHESFSSIYCINCIQYGILAKYRKHLSHAHLLNELRSVVGEKAGVCEGRLGRREGR